MENAFKRDNYSYDLRGNNNHTKGNPEEDQSSLLRTEVDYLRNELENITRQNSKSLIELKHYQEQQLSKLHGEKEADLQQEFSRILTLQKILSQESDACSRIRQSILNLKLEHSERYTEMNADLER